MSASKLDAVYRSILITKFFTKGWGKPENLRRLFEFRKVVSNRDECFKLVEKDYPVTITKEQNLTDCKLLEGYFITPLERYLPGIVPEIAQKAHFQVLLPLHWQQPSCKPMCLHLAGTGDHFFWRRRNLMVKPLLKEAGIGGIILENPFYGLRKPTDQVRSSLHNVSDIFVMGGCLILESLVLFHWCERNGLGPLGVTGLSMGGHMASLAATNWPKPLVLVPCLSWSTASAVFLQGVMSHSINWDLLEDQYLSDGIYRDKLSKMVTIIDEAFLAGKKFAQKYTQSIDKNTPNITDTKVISPLKELDITYKETHKLLENQINGMSLEEENVRNNLVEKQTGGNNVSKTLDSNNITVDLSSLSSKLKSLLGDREISVELYEKLSSNDKFELTPQDIEEINNLSEKDIKDKLLSHRTVSESAQPKDKIPEKQNRHENSNNINTHNTTAQNLEIQNSEVLLQTDTKPTEIFNLEVSNQQQIISNTNTEEEFSEKHVSPISQAKIMTLVADAKKSRKWNVTDLTSELWNLPFFRPSGKKIDISKIHWRDREALQFMRGIMDECTHLSNFSVPYDTSLIIAVCAKHDAYVPREDVGTLEEIWPGVDVRYVDAGHVSAYILHQSMFRSCIIEAFERSKKKFKDGKHID